MNVSVFNYSFEHNFSLLLAPPKLRKNSQFRRERTHSKLFSLSLSLTFYDVQKFTRYQDDIVGNYFIVRVFQGHSRSHLSPLPRSHNLFITFPEDENTRIGFSRRLNFFDLSGKWDVAKISEDTRGRTRSLKEMKVIRLVGHRSNT